MHHEGHVVHKKLHTSSHKAIAVAVIIIALVLAAAANCSVQGT